MFFLAIDCMKIQNVLNYLIITVIKTAVGLFGLGKNKY